MQTMTAAPSPPSISDAVDATRKKVGDDPARAVVRLRTEGRMGGGTRVELRAGTPAPSAVRCSVALEGPEPAGRYRELAAAVDEHCPVLDLFSRPVPVERSVTTA